MKLTTDEIAIARKVGFDEEVCLLVKSHAKKKLERLQETLDYGKLRPGPGISVAVKDGGDAERLMNALREELTRRGYRAFWSKRYDSDGMDDSDEVAILKTQDPYAMIKLRQTDGANFDVSTDDVMAKLDEWRNLCEFDVVGASGDWVALQFSRLPKNICRFAEDVYLICPDTVGQGVGYKYRNDKRRIAEARRLCPEPLSQKIKSEITTRMGNLSLADKVPPEFADLLGSLGGPLLDEVDTGIRLLAYELRETKCLFLWWD